MNHHLTLIRFFSFLTLLILGFSSFNASAEKLLPPGNGKIYFGANPGFGGNEDIVGKGSAIHAFDVAAGKKAMWSYFSNNWVTKIAYPRKNIQAIIDNGKIPFVRLLPMGNMVNGITHDVCGGLIDWSSFQTTKATYSNHCENMSVNSIYNVGGPTYKLRDIADKNNVAIEAELREWAKAAKKHYQQTHIPLLVDFAVEMNGYWFIWGGTHQDPEDYKAAYRRIVEIFEEEQVDHITWFFHVDIAETPYANENNNNPFKGDVFDPVLYYPGDEVIDWVGFSLYGLDDYTAEPDQWKTFSKVINATSNYAPANSPDQTKFEHLAAISNKPMALLEFAVTDNHQSDRGAKKSAWFVDALNSIKTLKDSTGKKRIKAITYWNEDWENALMSINPTQFPRSSNKFRKLISGSEFINTPKWSSNDSRGISPKGQTSNPIVFKWEASANTVNYELVYGKGNEPFVSIDLLPKNIGCRKNTGICTFPLPSNLSEGLGNYWSVISYDANWNFLSKSKPLSFSVSKLPSM
jgi:hypothetical protein